MCSSFLSMSFSIWKRFFATPRQGTFSKTPRWQADPIPIERGESQKNFVLQKIMTDRKYEIRVILTTYFKFSIIWVFIISQNVEEWSVPIKTWKLACKIIQLSYHNIYNYYSKYYFNIICLPLGCKIPFPSTMMTCNQENTLDIEYYIAYYMYLTGLLSVCLLLTHSP